MQQEYLPQKHPGKNILGVVRPMAEAVSSAKKFNKIGIIGTKATIKSQIYSREIKRLSPKLKILCRSAQLLVPLIESGRSDEEETKNVLGKYLRPLKTAKVDLLVLGCTHYPFLNREIRKIMGNRCEIYDSGEIVAKSLKDYLTRHKELAFIKNLRPKLIFYTTGDTNAFRVLGTRFFGKKIEHISQVTLKKRLV